MLRGANKVEGYELEQRVKRMRVPELRTLRKARDLRDRDYWPPSDQDKAAIKADILRQKTFRSCTNNRVTVVTNRVTVVMFHANEPGASDNIRNNVEKAP